MTPETQATVASLPPFDSHSHVLASKASATVAARLALAGYALIANVDGTFTVSRWGRVHDLNSLREVQDFARRVGAP